MAALAKAEATSGGKEHIDKTIQILTPAFENDPVYTWLLHGSFALSEHQRVLPKLLRAILTQGALNGGVFIEAGGFGCCGLFLPPGCNVENPWTMLRAGLIPALWSLGVRTLKRLVIEYPSGTEPHLKRVFTKEEQRNHWYVCIMGTAGDRRCRGLAGALLEHMQERARSGGGRPIWLEATTEMSRGLYLKHGFTNAGEVVLGRGKVDSDGSPKKGGQGIMIWSMFWRPSS